MEEIDEESQSERFTLAKLKQENRAENNIQIKKSQLFNKRDDLMKIVSNLESENEDVP